MLGVYIIDWIGGTSRFVTLFTFFIHFLNPFFCIVNYCAWVTDQQILLGTTIVQTYLALTIVGAIFYLFIASVFYMWAWRFPDPEEVSKRRRIYGILVNLIFSDLPLFSIGAKICWEVQFVSAIQGFSFVLSVFSFVYSAVRVWIFIMIKLIKIRAPVMRPLPQFSGSLIYPSDNRQLGQTGHAYEGNFVPRNGSYLEGGVADHLNNSDNFASLRQTPGDIYRQNARYTQDHYVDDRFSPPGRQSWPRI